MVMSFGACDVESSGSHATACQHGVEVFGVTTGTVFCKRRTFILAP
jgi:hypothetical protein